MLNGNRERNDGGPLALANPGQAGLANNDADAMDLPDLRPSTSELLK